MTIHPEQSNVEALCEVAHFVDSGFQSFHEQVLHLKAKDIPEAAFFAGAALTLRLLDYFHEPQFEGRDIDHLTEQLYIEVNTFMQKHDMALEWEPHMPKGKAQ